MKTSTPARSVIAETITKDYQGFDAIGFDVDHTLIRYNIPLLSRICYHAFLRAFVEKANDLPYSSELLSVQNPLLQLNEETDLPLALNYATIDIKNALLLKIGANKQVLQAYRGLRELTPQQIEEVYGQQRLLPHEYDADTIKQNKNYALLCGFFENVFGLLFCKVVNLYEQSQKQLVVDANFSQKVWETLCHAIVFNFTHFNDEQCFPMRECGYFFRAVADNLNDVVCTQAQVRRVLQLLRSRGIILFVASNSHYEYINLTMTHAYGADWQSLFDFMIGISGKPAFFSEQGLPLYALDLSAANIKKRVEGITAEHKFYFQGSCEYVEAYIRNIKQKEEVRLAFFGDSYIPDTHFSSKLKAWNAFVVCEELHAEGDSAVEEKRLLDYASRWGSFFHHSADASDIAEYTFWYELMRKNACGICFALDSPRMLEEFWRV